MSLVGLLLQIKITVSICLCGLHIVLLHQGPIQHKDPQKERPSRTWTVILRIKTLKL